MCNLMLLTNTLQVCDDRNPNYLSFRSVWMGMTLTASVITQCMMKRQLSDLHVKPSVDCISCLRDSSLYTEIFSRRQLFDKVAENLGWKLDAYSANQVWLGLPCSANQVWDTWWLQLGWCPTWMKMRGLRKETALCLMKCVYNQDFQ